MGDQSNGHKASSIPIPRAFRSLCFSPGEQRNLPGHNNFSEKKILFCLLIISLPLLMFTGFYLWKNSHYSRIFAKKTALTFNTIR